MNMNVNNTNDTIILSRAEYEALLAQQAAMLQQQAAVEKQNAELLKESTSLTTSWSSSVSLYNVNTAINTALGFCTKIFKEDKRINALALEKRYEERQKHLKALFDDFYA